MMTPSAPRMPLLAVSSACRVLVMMIVEKLPIFGNARVALSKLANSGK